MEVIVIERKTRHGIIPGVKPQRLPSVIVKARGHRQIIFEHNHRSVLHGEVATAQHVFAQPKPCFMPDDFLGTKGPVERLGQSRHVRRFAQINRDDERRPLPHRTA